LKAVDSIAENEVIVCSTGQSRRSGIWGELLTTAALTHHARGVVTDGTVRDIVRMTEMNFPVYAAGACAYDSYNRQKVVDYDVSIEIGGVRIDKGDIIVADIDGIAVVPQKAAAETLKIALEKVENENDFRTAVKGGMPLVEAYQKYQIL
ncbi:MAG: RraA family protein, partial [Pseudomonadota bacterium]